MYAGSDNEPSHSVQASANTDPCPPPRDTLHRALGFTPKHQHSQKARLVWLEEPFFYFFNCVYPSTSEKHSHCSLRFLSQCPEDDLQVCKCRCPCLSHYGQSSSSFPEYLVQLWTCSVFCSALHCLCVNDSLAAEREHLYTNWLEQVCTHNNKAGGKKPYTFLSRVSLCFRARSCRAPNSGALPRSPLLPSEHQ